MTLLGNRITVVMAITPKARKIASLATSQLKNLMTFFLRKDSQLNGYT
jgi:hypothetical protein